jgi:hypothetical protein
VPVIENEPMTQPDSETATELREILDLVSEEALGGRPVPADLAALWAAQINGDTDLLDAFELVLLDAMSSDEALEGFRVEDGVDVAAALALEAVVSTIGFVAEALDGALLGYWFGVASAPVVLFDSAGQLELLGATLAEALIALSDPDDDEEVAEVVAGLHDLGVPCASTNHDEVLDRVHGVPQPNDAVLNALMDARLRGS